MPRMILCALVVGIVLWMLYKGADVYVVLGTLIISAGLFRIAVELFHLLKKMVSDIWFWRLRPHYRELRKRYEELRERYEEFRGIIHSFRENIHSFLAGDARAAPTGRLGGYRQMELGHQFLDLPRAEADITYERPSEESESLVERKTAERQAKAKRTAAAKKGWTTRRNRESAKRRRRYREAGRIESPPEPISEKNLESLNKKAWT